MYLSTLPDAYICGKAQTVILRVRSVQPVLATCLPTGYTDLAMSTVTQRLSLIFSGTVHLLRFYLSQLSSGEVTETEKDGTVTLCVFNSVNVTVYVDVAMVEVGLRLPQRELCTYIYICVCLLRSSKEGMQEAG